MATESFYTEVPPATTSLESSTPVSTSAMQHEQHPQQHSQYAQQVPTTGASMSPPLYTNHGDYANYGDYAQNQSQQQQQQQQQPPPSQQQTPQPRPDASPQASFHSRQISADNSLNSPAPGGPTSDELYTATYSGIPVFEMMVNGVAVMRRRHDSCLNATQILKVAGVEKSKRTKVLEKEILTGEHEKVQGGYGKYQGTWIPFDRGVALCRQYSVYDSLQPLLQFDPTNQMENTPTKEQALAAKRKRTLGGSSARNSMTGVAPFSNPLQVGSAQNTPLSSHASAALSNLGGRSLLGRQDTIVDNEINGGAANDGPPLKRQRVGNNGGGGGGGDSPLEDDILPDIAIPLEPLDLSYLDQNVVHSITRLFVSRDQEGDPVQLLANMPEINRDNIDIPIDDSGHTALHWASALAMAPLVRELVRCGANPQRGNYSGETTLVRAVLVTNSFDVAMFPQLLESLYPAIPLVDKNQRTVLHHIALTAGIKGRSGASKYYLEGLLEWIVKRGSKGKTKRYGLDRFMHEVVNKQDKHGDTALNIAARVGNKSICQQLLDVGANPHISNRANLKPTDFGITVGSQSSNSDAPVAAPQPSQATDNSNVTAEDAAEKRKTTLEAITKMMTDLDGEFTQELEASKQQIEAMQTQLHGTTTKLTSKRERLEELKGMNNKLIECQRSTENLDRAIEDEDKEFNQQMNGAGGQFNFEGDFDADQPFVIDPNQQLPLGVVLRARISAYKRNQEKLEQLGFDLRSRSSALEQKFRKVVSLCTGVEEERVDPLLEGLVQAVQSDRDDMDIDRVAGFLRKIDRSHQGGVVM